MNNVCLFDEPLQSKKVRKGVWAHKYRTGVININGHKFQGYSMTAAIALWRKQNPL